MNDFLILEGSGLDFRSVSSIVSIFLILIFLGTLFIIAMFNYLHPNNKKKDNDINSSEIKETGEEMINIPLTPSTPSMRKRLGENLGENY